jgi:hypothetical protein
LVGFAEMIVDGGMRSPTVSGRCNESRLCTKMSRSPREGNPEPIGLGHIVERKTRMSWYYMSMEGSHCFSTSPSSIATNNA